jgi:hypothetical protein
MRLPCASRLVRLRQVEYFCAVSTVAEIVAVVKKLPEAQKHELLEKLREIETKPTGTAPKPFVVKTWPLGIRGDKPPSHLLEESEDEDYLRKARAGR